MLALSRMVPMEMEKCAVEPFADKLDVESKENKRMK